MTTSPFGRTTGTTPTPRPPSRSGGMTGADHETPPSVENRTAIAFLRMSL
jgi:hypothetical protein